MGDLKQWSSHHYRRRRRRYRRHRRSWPIEKTKGNDAKGIVLVIVKKKGGGEQDAEKGEGLPYVRSFNRSSSS
jgi:hypothetical protein